MESLFKENLMDVGIFRFIYYVFFVKQDSIAYILIFRNLHNF